MKILSLYLNEHVLIGVMVWLLVALIGSVGQIPNCHQFTWNDMAFAGGFFGLLVFIGYAAGLQRGSKGGLG